MAGMLLFTVEDPSGTLPEQVILMPHSRGIKLHKAQGEKGVVGDVLTDWRWATIKQLTKDSGLPDEMDELRVEVRPSAGGMSKVYLFECDSADAVILAINTARRSASEAANKLLGLGLEQMGEGSGVTSPAKVKASWGKLRAGSKMTGIFAVNAAKSRRTLIADEKIFDVSALRTTRAHIASR